jgi:hypothetical protein
MVVNNPTPTVVFSSVATAGTPTGTMTLAAFGTQPDNFPEPGSSTTSVPPISQPAMLPTYSLYAAYYSAVLDWGDGSPPADAFIT